jgi:hypothetical protein
MSNVGPVTGKPWSVESTHTSYESADQKRNSLVSNENLQVKVRRSSAGTFTVRVRALVTEEPKKKQNLKNTINTTGKPRNKSEKRKLREQKKKQKKTE